MSFKLYFKYGAMGCSKSAQALMAKFNYEQQGYNVLLLKPDKDTRDDHDGKKFVKSRIGLEAEAVGFSPKTNLKTLFKKHNKENPIGVIILDECQFCTESHINQLKELTAYVPVLCYGLKTDFRTKLFEGSKRLIEIADSIVELKSICACGRKATINARLSNGRIVTRGSIIEIGGNERYKALCYDCFIKQKNEQKKNAPN